MTIRKLAESVKQPTAYNRIANLVSSTGTKANTQSIINYIKYLRESCLIFSIDNYASKFVEKESVKKHYFIDNGLLNIFLTDAETSLLENICAIQLHKKYGSEVYFYNKGIEVDFYIPENETAIQVSYDISDDNTLQREKGALEKLCERYTISRALIITYNTETSLQLRNDMTVEVVPVWKWLLEE